MSEHKIGFMQGRLSPLVDGKIQAFPWQHWADEFLLARKHGLSLMEWTLDHDRLFENPLMNQRGREQIRQLQLKYDVAVESLTGDVFMQAPFWKVTGAEHLARLEEFDAIVEACALAGIKFIVMPLVDNGCLATQEEEACVVAELTTRAGSIRESGVVVVFESDFIPERLAEFIGKLPKDCFGINYDIGNSAALGFDCTREISTFGPRVRNVHIKDRKLGGTTVPLGTGNADIPRALGDLILCGYKGNFILQSARANDGDHAGALVRYRNMVQDWLSAIKKP